MRNKVCKKLRKMAHEEMVAGGKTENTKTKAINGQVTWDVGTAKRIYKDLKKAQ